MFEPRSRGFSDPLLGQPFYGWYCAPLAPGFFAALGRLQRPSGAWGGATTCRPRRHVVLAFRQIRRRLLMFAKYSVGAQRAAPALARHLLCPKTTLYSAGINKFQGPWVARRTRPSAGSRAAPSHIPQPVTPLAKTHLPHSTPLAVPDPLEPRHSTVPWSWSHCSHERNNDYDYECTN